MERAPLSENDLKVLGNTKGDLVIGLIIEWYNSGKNIDPALESAIKKGCRVTKVLEKMLVGGEVFHKDIDNIFYRTEQGTEISLKEGDLTTSEGKGVYQKIYQQS